MNIYDLSQISGFAGAIISCMAYIPQIIHLIKEKCAEGISIKAFASWFLASSLLLFHAIMIKSVIFILFQTGSLLAISIILIFAYKYRKHLCKKHKNMMT